MYEFKNIGKVLTSKFVGTGPSSYDKRIYRPLGLTNVKTHWSRGVLPTVVCHFVWSRNLVNVEALVHWGLSRQKQTNKQ
jgi:hypothetical protein